MNDRATVIQPFCHSKKRYRKTLESHIAEVFLSGYDMQMAQELVQGMDLWINTPRRPWEACGTSGMKVLANGGLNISELDGWWAAVPLEAGQILWRR